MDSSKVAIVSGGSRGLGQALVSRLLTEGWRVATFSRSATAFTEECSKQSVFHWKSVDAESRSELRLFVEEALERFGRLDALVNNAAVSTEGVLALTRDEDIDRCLTINLANVVHLTRLCVRALLLRPEGSIVSISSILGLRGHDGAAVYGATKAAIDGLTRGLARELGERNIRVNAVAPGYFESDMTADMNAERKERIARRTPLRRLGTVDDIVGAVHFLLSPEARFITGQTLVVDGGFTC